MKITRIPVGAYQANCYIVIDEDTNEALVIDPGDDFEIIKREIDRLNINVKYIFLTHGHADHTSAVKKLKDYLNCSVCINEKDEEFIKNNAYMFGTVEEFGVADTKIKEEDTFNIGNMKLSCIETPGHTLGGMCFLIDNVVFTGDTLFEGSIGRTDFQGGDFNTIIDSIKNKLLVLPEDTVVLPGHGLESNIGKEKRYNPFL